jgi:aminopeptidase
VLAPGQAGARLPDRNRAALQHRKQLRAGVRRTYYPRAEVIEPSARGEFVMKYETSKIVARPAILATATLLFAGGIQPAQAQSAGTEAQTAQRIVGQTAGVTKDEIVQIEGTPRDLRLLEKLATEVRKKGAFPLVTLASDRIVKSSYTEVSAELDSQAPKLDLVLADIVDVLIVVGDFESPDLLADVPDIAARRSARGKAFEPVIKKQVESNLRLVEINNGLYPAAWRAKRFGTSEDELARIFWQGVNVDYANLQARGRELEKKLRAGNEVYITAANGTDLKVRIAGRPVIVSDGIISSEDKKRGGTAAWAYLPAGDVYVTPVAGTARGKVVIPQQFFDGREVRDLALTFKDGKLTSMSGGGPGYAGLKAQYDAVNDQRKADFAVVDLGINESLKPRALPLAAELSATGAVFGYSVQSCVRRLTGTGVAP